MPRGGRNWPPLGACAPATAVITWDINWQEIDGTAGALPPLFTTATVAFGVAQSQALNTSGGPEPASSPRRLGDACGSRRVASTRTELAEQFGGGLVRDAEAGAERVTGDRLPVRVLVLRGGPAREREQGLVLLVLPR
jgi:hypothetical protein